MRFVKNPIEFEAVQYTGRASLEQLRAFTGVRRDSNGHETAVFYPIGTFLIPEIEHPERTAELWVEANQRWLPIEDGEWVIKDQLGFYPCKDEVMQTNNTPIDDECTCEPLTFEQELVGLLNKHSMENYSGTPDWILTEYIRKSLEAFDVAVRLRASWRGEDITVPALLQPPFSEETVRTNFRNLSPDIKAQIVEVVNNVLAPNPPNSAEMKGLGEHISKGLQEGLKETLRVPLVEYETTGRRNEIGEAELTVWPGEVRVSGTIEGVIPMIEGVTLDPRGRIY